MKSKNPLGRRTFLKGVGATIALPLLDAMAPAHVRAASSAAKPPCRMAFVYVPNGMHMADWTPAKEGADFALPHILEPLKDVRSNLLVLSGLAHGNARALGDGGGDHARAGACFLTGVHPKKTHGADIQCGVSIDQLAAEAIGGKTRFPSLELGCDRGSNSGNCDSGYSCAYSANISWRTPSTPMAKEIDPRSVFERLFGTGTSREAEASRLRRAKYNKSILDFVREQTNDLKRDLGPTDQRKIDEYLFAVRDIEKRIVAAEKAPKVDPPKDLAEPTGVPDDYAEHIRLMFDLLYVAFQADLTRVATFIMANEGSNRNYRFLDVPEGHHTISHHQSKPDLLAKIKKINRFHMEQFAYFTKKLQASSEGAGNLLEHSMIVYASAIGDGNRHNHDELPVLLAGRAAGALKTGRHLRYKKNTPMTNLFLSMLDTLGLPTDKFGDSNGKLDYLSDLST